VRGRCRCAHRDRLSRSPARAACVVASASRPLWIARQAVPFRRGRRRDRPPRAYAAARVRERPVLAARSAPAAREAPLVPAGRGAHGGILRTAGRSG
jgi:hypothetical protein